jgi:hypothetical protein
MSPSQRLETRRGREVMRQRRRCLFCGALPSDTHLIERMNDLVCDDCFNQIGIVFAEPGNTLFFVRSEKCMSCKRTAHARLLVAGVAAAICKKCYFTIKGRTSAAEIDPAVYPPKGARLRALQRARAARLRDRRQDKHLGKTFRSLRAEDRATRGFTLLVRQGLTRWRMASHLDLVTSRDHVGGRRAFKLPDGRRRLYPYADSRRHPARTKLPRDR